jgi:drug/metabolite transporter (DMT)-like permease
MRGFSFLFFVALTILMWGIYGPVLHVGQEQLGDGQQLSRWNPFICVGVAYFLIAVVYPLIMIPREGKGNWAPAGIFWSFSAGAVGAIGALGIILAFMFGGTPVFVMPLVFGFAPVINTMVTMLMSRTIREASLVFYLGVLVVAIGGAGVMFFKPKPPRETAMLVQPLQEQVATAETSDAAPADPLPESVTDSDGNNSRNFWWMVAAVVLTALCWGSYGPVLHKGQARMGGSRLRPFLFVGLAYFVIAVALPLILGNFLPPDPGQWNTSGVLWSLAAGAAGAIGALGIIYAFNFGGKPIFVMPLVFGGAPVVNTLTSTISDQLFNQLTYPFFISLFLVIAGAVTVLTTAPRGKPKPTPEIT